jgi:hypothetical protein
MKTHHKFTSAAARTDKHRLLACALAVIGAGALPNAHAQTPPPHNETVLDYAGRWTFDDCTVGNALRDTSGNTATGVKGSSVFCAPDWNGKQNGAVLIAGAQPGQGASPTTVSVTKTTAFPFSNDLSVSVRVLPLTTPDGAILTKSWTGSDGVAQRTFQLSIEKESSTVSRVVFKLFLKPQNGATPVEFTIRSKDPIPKSAWSKVGASFDGLNGMRLFINDKLVASTPRLFATIADAPVGIASRLWMGGSTGPQTVGYVGMLDDVWVSNGSCTDLQSTRTASNEQELMIRDLTVVNDTVRTTGDGAWTFGRLMTQMVPANASDPQATADAASDMVEAMFRTLSTDQTINKQPVKARTLLGGVDAKLFGDDGWPRVNGKLDLTRSPLRLLAIVNRMDLRSLSKGHAGEGRFIFGVLDKDGSTSQFTVILEYQLPASTAADVRNWARDWHALGTKTLGTPEYNIALQAITDRFTSRGAAPKRFNGSAIGQVRTNELALAGPWELREFELGAGENGVTRLNPAPVAMTPAQIFNGSPALTQYITENATAIKNGMEVPLTTTVGGTLLSFFRAGASPNQPTTWTAPDLSPTLLPIRHLLALNTCNGCHSSRETRTSFLHVFPRQAGTVATLSGFLTGTSVADPVDGTVRNFNDLKRRQEDMNQQLLVCRAPGSATTSASTTTTLSAKSSTSVAPAPTTSLTQGISRVH